MNVKPLFLLLMSFATAADAEVCPGEYASDSCNVVLSVIPSLESLGIPVADMNQQTFLGSTGEGKPYAAIAYVVHSEPMTEADIAAAKGANFDAISSEFIRDLYRIHCGQQMRMGIVSTTGSTFVNAGGEVSYRISLFLMNEAKRSEGYLTFGEAYIASCGD
jgi:hypothetical protein